MKKLFGVMVLSASLTACGGGGGGGDDDSKSTGGGSGDSGTSTPVNVALQSRGGVASSTFSGNESFVNDGDTTGTVGFWEPGAADDSVTVAFDKTYALSKVSVYGVSVGSNSTYAVALSTDGVSYKALKIPSDCTISMTLSSNALKCSFPGVNAAFLRLTVINPTNIKIHEIEAIGQ